MDLTKPARTDADALSSLRSAGRPVGGGEAALYEPVPEEGILKDALARLDGGLFAVDGPPGCGKSTLLARLEAHEGYVAALVAIPPGVRGIELLQALLLRLTGAVMRRLEAEDRREAEQESRRWQARAKRQLFTPLFWTVRWLRLLSASLFGLVAIAFIVLQFAPGLIEGPVERLGELAVKLVALLPAWVWVLLLLAATGAFLALRLQRRLQRQYDEAVSELADWIPDARVRGWFGLETDDRTLELAGRTRVLGKSIIAAQSPVAGAGAASGGFAIGGTAFNWRTGGTVAGARVLAVPSIIDEFRAFIGAFADRWPCLLLVDGRGAAEQIETLRMLAMIPRCYVVVEGAAAETDLTVMIAPWPPARLTSMLERRFPDAGRAYLESVATRAAGNPRAALRGLAEDEARTARAHGPA